MIDPTAIIDPAAELADDVKIGPYTVISAEVKIGAGTVIGPHVVVNGSTTIGEENRIFQFCSIGEEPQDKKYAQEPTRLDIGDRNTIREYCTMHRGTVQDRSLTKVGSDNLFMAYTHVAHDCVIGDGVVMANGASLAGHVYLDDYAILGGFTLVHQFTKVGCYSFSAMGSSLSRDLPPYVMVGGRPTKPYGINSVGLERSGFSVESIRKIRKAYKILYKSRLKMDEATEQLTEMAKEDEAVQRLVDFLKRSERSIIR